jgi:Pin2-interacting protein X1
MAKKFRDKILQGSGFSNLKFESEYGMNLMKKMGWTEGKGLGKEETGMATCIQMRRREDNLGLGFEKSEKFRWNNNWWENSYNNSIKSLDIDFNESDKESTNDNSDEEGGPNQNRLKRRKNRLNYGKQPNKTLKQDSKKKDESTETESEEEEEERILPNSKKIKKRQC